MADALFQLASRVLIVDDERHIARFLEFLLNKEGYQTAVAYDGVEALEKYVAFHPDAILLDVMLPRLSGVEVLRKISELTVDPALRPAIILLTGLNLQDLPADIMGCGVSAHCPKPVAPSALIRLLRHHGLFGYSPVSRRCVVNVATA